MALRCSPNDLCVISYVPDEALVAFKGRFVTAIRLAKDGDFDVYVAGGARLWGPIWIIGFSGERPNYLDHNDRLPPNIGFWPDAWMRPIRGDEGTDESLTLTGCPDYEHQLAVRTLWRELEEDIHA